MIKIRHYLTVYLLLVAFLASGQTALRAQAATTTGPEKGSLVIVGGGSVGDDILLKFIELAGGPEVPIVVIPTAAGQAVYDQDTGVTKAFRRLGAENVIVLHTDDPLEADRPAFTQPIENAGGVWFGGGRQWRLVDA